MNFLFSIKFIGFTNKKQNVLHNDVRCENFLISNDIDQNKRIMLRDFGNALILNKSDNSNEKLFKKEKKDLKKLLNYTK